MDSTPLGSRLRAAAFASILVTLIGPRLVAQCTTQWLPGQGVPGVVGAVAALTQWDPDGAGPAPRVVVCGGDFTFAGSVVANNIATYEPATGTWSPLGTGMNENVCALTTLPNGDLVAGGSFTTAGGVAANHIARWNGTAWSPLGAGVSGGSSVAVLALMTLPNGDVLAGGEFAMAGGVVANSIARWNGTAWSPLGTGMLATNVSIGSVSALTMLRNGDVVAGGTFSTAGFLPANNIAKWNGTTWSPLGTGVSSSVLALTTLRNGDVVVGGPFMTAGAAVANGVARWNGTAWSMVGTGLDSYACAVTELPNGDVVVGGYFNLAGGVAAKNIARWNGAGWSPLGTGTDDGVRALTALPNGDVVAGGSLRSAGGVAANGIARWNGAVWRALDKGIDHGMSALAPLPNGDLVAGGGFRWLDAVAANHIARWNGTLWSPLGLGTDGPVLAVTTLPNGDVIAGGCFTTAGGVAANCIARWNGTSWSPLGIGMSGGLPTAVSALTTLPNGDVIAGGYFTTAGGVTVDNIARWNGTSWSPLGTGMFGIVYSLVTMPNGDVAAGGSFNAAGGVAANRVARWDGASWSPLGTGVNGSGFVAVFALSMLPTGDIVAGGNFTTAAGFVANHIARWDGTAWSPLGTGMSGGSSSAVLAMTTLPNGDLAVGGEFTTAGGVPANRIARWNGAAWSVLGGAGLDSYVRAMTTRPDGELVVGGDFTTAGGNISAYFARLTTTCPATVASQGAGCTGSGGPNVLVATALPWIGSTFRARATGMPALGFVVAATGLTTLSLPLSSVLPQGQPGCSLLVSPDLIDVLLPVAGTADSQLVLPNAASLVGRSFHHQMVPFELGPSSAITALTSTNALAATIGAF